jgi:hypothetical protein
LSKRLCFARHLEPLFVTPDLANINNSVGVANAENDPEGPDKEYVTIIRSRFANRVWIPTEHFVDGIRCLCNYAANVRFDPEVRNFVLSFPRPNDGVLHA